MKRKDSFTLAMLIGISLGTAIIAGGDGEEDGPTCTIDDVVCKGMGANRRKLSADRGVQMSDGAYDSEVCVERVRRYVAARFPLGEVDSGVIRRGSDYAGREDWDNPDRLHRLIRCGLGSSESDDMDQLSHALMGSAQPSTVVREWGQKSGIQEVEDLRGIQQNSKWHPEGDAFEHSMLVLDAAARLTYVNEPERRIFLLAALCHDLGKRAATAFVDGQWRAHGHAARGVKPTLSLLRRFYVEDEIVEPVCELVRFHMMPHNMAREGATVRAYRELAHSFECITLSMLLKLVLCDLQGVSNTGRPSTEERFDVLEKFGEGARNAGVLE